MTTRDSGAPKFLNCFPKIPNSAQRFADFYYVFVFKQAFNKESFMCLHR